MNIFGNFTMTFKLISSLAVAIATIFFSSMATASGGSGSGNFNRAPVKQIDESYEYGKSIFLGRKAGFEKFSYCVDVGGERLPLKRKSLAKFKKTSFSEVAAALYDCDTPTTKIADEIAIQDFQFVLYYLNKRFRLALN